MTHEPHRGYTPHIEFGTFVWYRTTRSVTVSVNMKTGVEQRAGTAMNRIVTNTADYKEACAQLDRAISKPKKEQPITYNPDQKSLF